MEHKNPHATHVLEPKTQAESSWGETLEFIHKNIDVGFSIEVWKCVFAMCVCVFGVCVVYFVVWRV